MFSTIEVPVWLTIFVAVLAAAAVVHYLILPGIRWTMRRRVDRVIQDVNPKLRVAMPAFQLTSRKVLIDRLANDPKILEAAEAAVSERGTSRSAVMAEITRYAREIVPAFNAYFYFRLGYWLARGTLRMLYHVRPGYAHEAAFNPIKPGTSVVFFINHRSNMDYLLVTYLASRSAALSYGAGEWCRFWPFRSVLRLAGAYILRRNTRDPLYRKVVERYVQIATEAGVPHAIFGEGRLSRDGRVNPPKLGLLGYITKTFDPDDERDILFVPVATNFDRVLEERTLIANAETDFRGRGAVFVLGSAAGFAIKQAWRKATGRWIGFGSACANFGEPLSLRSWSRQRNLNFSELDQGELFEAVEELGLDLTERVIQVMPVMPVPAVSMVLINQAEPIDTLELKRRSQLLMEDLRKAGAHIASEEGREDAVIEEVLSLLTRRGVIVKEGGDLLAPAPHERQLLEYYANSIAQLCSRIDMKVPIH